MSEMENLTTLRNKLVARRRQLVEAQIKMPGDQLTGDSVASIQEAIDAVDRALADESEEGKVINIIVFRVLPTMPIAICGTSVIDGGAIDTFWRSA
jgi:hypothetical protein